MKLLKISDLRFTPLNYKLAGPATRDWVLAAIENVPVTFSKLSIVSGIKYRTLLRFIKGDTEYMSYENMVKLREHIQSLMNCGIFEEEENKPVIDLSNDIKKDQFFEG